MLRRPGVDRKFAVHVRRRGDDGGRAERCGKPAGERIGPADVPGEQRNDEIRPLVEAEHRRIRPFVADIRRDLPHRDPSRTDKDQRVHFRKRRAIDRFFKRQKSRLRQPRHRITKRFRLRQCHTDTQRRFASSTAVSENRNVHFVASRNSVVNEGS